MRNDGGRGALDTDNAFLAGRLRESDNHSMEPKTITATELARNLSDVLSRVRYNQVQYNRKDIEEAIAVPARDRLVVETYLQHVPNRKGVAFAVNVRHGRR